MDLPSICKALFLVILSFSILNAQTPKRTFRATAYCHYGKGCTKGQYKGITATGVKVRRGVIAVDPRLIPLGSKVEIIEPVNYAGMYDAADTGGAIKGDIIDIWVPDITEARQFGRKKVVLRVYPPAPKPKKKKFTKEI